MDEQQPNVTVGFWRSRLLLCYRAFFTSCQRLAAFTCSSSSISNPAQKLPR